MGAKEQRHQENHLDNANTRISIQNTGATFSCGSVPNRSRYATAKSHLDNQELEVASAVNKTAELKAVLFVKACINQWFTTWEHPRCAPGRSRGSSKKLQVRLRDCNFNSVQSAALSWKWSKLSCRISHCYINKGRHLEWCKQTTRH